MSENQRDTKPSYNHKNNGRGYRGGRSNRGSNYHTSSNRNFRGGNNSNFRRTDKHRPSPDEETQRERLAEELNRGALECLVCCERIRQQQSIWSCPNCYHVLHLNCVARWARASSQDQASYIGWRCPACQNLSEQIPTEYLCYCGTIQDPQYDPSSGAHSCGQLCQRPFNCPHRCKLLCHPGPCPKCNNHVLRRCGCGKVERRVRCSESPILCGEICGKLLECKIHHCTQTCHIGSCSSCEEIVSQKCHCGKATRDLPCTADTSCEKNYSCQQLCEKVLACGNHKCQQHCHSGNCNLCSKLPSVVKVCPCGKKNLNPEEFPRNSCLDPIPSCGEQCCKELSCGHICPKICHEGSCPLCLRYTSVRCRCGNIEKEIPCEGGSRDLRCERKCNKKRACGKHKCGQQCCIDLEHTCPLPCNRPLPCGNHRCEDLCHRGHCKPCWRTSFDELRCECGFSVTYPPVPCGTRRPQCPKPCSRRHSCGHSPLHTCHSENECPPCTLLTERLCHGGHELRKAVPCYVESISCGRPCGKPLPCGRHNCITSCHAGPCLVAGKVCQQLCKIQRSECGHPCASPCHEGMCPETPCKQVVKVTCLCKHRSTSRICADNASEYKRLAMAQLASKMSDLALGLSVPIGDEGCTNITASSLSNALMILECNDECRIFERNKRMAIGLQIKNPDLSAKLTPRYSDIMRNWVKRDPNFCKDVHSRLEQLVTLAQNSKQKSRSHSFEPMNRERRQFVHEYCQHFGCQSEAYDPEPKRNVVATALKDKSWLPALSLLEVVEREKGTRRLPRPVMVLDKGNSMPQASMDVLGHRQSGQNSAVESNIDYFDMKPRIN